MNRKELFFILKKSIIPVILLAWMTAFLIVGGVKYFNILPKTYVIQSQLVVNPKITDEKDSVKSMDLLKYNENYNLLVYSSSFLDKVAKKFDNKQFKDPLKLKSQIKVLYSVNCQVLTIQVHMTNEQEGIKLANIILEELRTEGNKQFVHCSLSVLSQAVTTYEFTYSTSLLLIVLSFAFLVVYLLVVLFYHLRSTHKRVKKGKVKKWCDR